MVHASSKSEKSMKIDLNSRFTVAVAKYVKTSPKHKVLLQILKPPNKGKFDLKKANLYI